MTPPPPPVPDPDAAGPPPPAAPPGAGTPGDDWLTSPLGHSLREPPSGTDRLSRGLPGRRGPSGGREGADGAGGVSALPPLAVPLPRRRVDRLALGVLALAGAVVLLVYGLAVSFGGGGPTPAAPPAAPAAPAALARFDLPAGWEDRSKDLADDVSGVRADFVFLGPASHGFRSNLNVVRQPGGAGTPPLDDLVGIVRERVRAELSAELIEPPWPLSLGGDPALAYDYRYRADGRRLQARQIVVRHGDTVVFVNFTADQRAFERQAKALDVLTGSWRWG